MAFEFLVDWDNNGNYAGSYDDISADVKMATWQNGMMVSFQDAADEAMAELQVRNADGKYSPENAASPLYGNLVPQRRVRIQDNTGGGSVIVMYQGWLNVISPGWTPAGSATGQIAAELSCVGFKQRLQEIMVPLTYYTDVTPDEVIMDVLLTAQLPPSEGVFWLVGVPGFSELDTTTCLGDIELIADLDTGTLNLPFYGDTMLVDTYSIIEELTAAERGKFYQGRDGRAYWWNKTHLLPMLSNDGTISSAGDYRPVAVDYGYGRLLANNVRVTAYQRTVEGAPEVLWSLVEPVMIPAANIRKLEITLRRSTGQFAASGALTTSGEAFSAGTATIEIIEQGGKAILQLTNSGGTDAVLSALTINGAPVVTQNALIAEVEDMTITTYGRRQIQFDLAALGDFDTALGIANYEMGRRPLMGDIQSVRLIAQADGISNAHMITFGEIGTRLNLDIDELFHDADYFVIGERHQFYEGLHVVDLYTEPALLSGSYWILGEPGFSELGETTVLAY